MRPLLCFEVTMRQLFQFEVTMRPLFEFEVIIFSDIGMHNSQLYSLNLFQVNNVQAIFVFFST